MRSSFIAVAVLVAGCPTVHDIYIDDAGTKVVIFMNPDSGRVDAGNFCDVCTCSDGTCPVDPEGYCANGPNCTLDAGTKHDAGSEKKDAGHPHDAGPECSPCTCDDGTCPINKAGDCSDGYNCETNNYCGVCTCDNGMCPFDTAGDCFDDYNCKTRECKYCECDDGTCSASPNGDCTDQTNCLDAGPPYVDAGPTYVDAGPPYVDAGPPYVDAGPQFNLQSVTITGQLTYDPCELQWRGYSVGGCGNGAPQVWTQPGSCSNGQAADGTAYDAGSAAFPAVPPCLAGDTVTIIDQIRQYEGESALGSGTSDSTGAFSISAVDLVDTDLGVLGSATDPSGLIDSSASILALPTFTASNTENVTLYVVSVAFMQHIASVIGMTYDSMIQQGVALVHVVPTGSEASASGQELFGMYGQQVGNLTPGFNGNVSLSKMPSESTMTSAPYTYYLSADLNFVLDNVSDDVTTSSSGLVVIVEPAPVVDQSDSQDENAYTVNDSGEDTFSVFGDQVGGVINAFIPDGDGQPVTASGVGLQSENASGQVLFDPAELQWRGYTSFTPTVPCGNGQDADGGTYSSSDMLPPCLDGDSIAMDDQYLLSQGGASLATGTVNWDGTFSGTGIDLVNTAFEVLGNVTDPSGLAEPTLSTLAVPSYTSQSLLGRTAYVVSEAYMQHIATTIGMDFNTMIGQGVALVHVVESDGVTPAAGVTLYFLNGLPPEDFTPGFNSNAYLTQIPFSSCPGSDPAAYYLGANSDGVMACNDGAVGTSSSGVIVLVGPPSLVNSAGSGVYTETAYTVSTSGEGPFAVFGAQPNVVTDVFLPQQ